jgi:hypothetical protein
MRNVWVYGPTVAALATSAALAAEPLMPSSYNAPAAVREPAPWIALYGGSQRRLWVGPSTRPGNRRFGDRRPASRERWGNPCLTRGPSHGLPRAVGSGLIINLIAWFCRFYGDDSDYQGYWHKATHRQAGLTISSGRRAHEVWGRALGCGAAVDANGIPAHQLCFLRTAVLSARRLAERAEGPAIGADYDAPGRERVLSNITSSTACCRGGEELCDCSSFLLSPTIRRTKTPQYVLKAPRSRSVFSSFPPSLTRWQRLHSRSASASGAGARPSNHEGGPRRCAGSRMCRKGACPEFNMKSLSDPSSETIKKCLTTTAGIRPFRRCVRNRFSSSAAR